MKFISDVLEEKIEQIFVERGYTPLYTPDKKILILDEDFTTHYKIDINYNNSDFSCIVLKRKGKFLTDLKNFNIPWTNGVEISAFLDFLRSN